MKTEDFCKSLDFMKLGQAVNHENWQGAASILCRMQRRSAEMDEDLFGRNFSALRQCLLHKDQTAAKSVLAVIAAKRAKIWNGQERAEQEDE